MPARAQKRERESATHQRLDGGAHEVGGKSRLPPRCVVGHVENKVQQGGPGPVVNTRIV